MPYETINFCTTWLSLHLSFHLDKALKISPELYKIKYHFENRNGKSASFAYNTASKFYIVRYNKWGVGGGQHSVNFSVKSVNPNVNPAHELLKNSRSGNIF